MLTNKYARLPLSEITFDRETRQRREIETSDLEESIRLRGVIQPIIVSHEGVLLAGERRYTASLRLGLPDIPVRFVKKDVSPLDLQVIELEENIRRQDLVWQDRCRAFAKMWGLHKTAHPEASVDSFAESVGFKKSTVYNELQAAEALEAGNPRIAAAQTATQARNIIARQGERAVQNAIADLVDTIASPKEAEAIGIIQVPKAEDDILCKSFLEWAPTYVGPKFNLIHMDFPYGIDLQDSDQAQAGAREAYADQEEIYWKLLDSLADNWDRIVSQSAHIFFWFSGKFRRPTEDFFSSRLPQIEWSPYDLIWHKTDNKGIVSDVTRYPRHVYETCMFGRVGDRKNVKCVSDAYGAPKANSDHVSEKPEPMLRHFFSMCVDGNTRLLDPTCGSGASLRAAESLGAERVLGLEINDEFCASARARLRQARSVRLLGEKG